MNKIKFRSDMDLKWLFNSKFPIPKQNYVLIVPGGSRKRKNKRLPLEIFNKIMGNFVIDNSKFINDTKWKPPYNNNEGIKKTCLWYKRRFKI